MDIVPQFTHDRLGNPIGVFLTIEDWTRLGKSFAADAVLQWEKGLILKGLAEYHANKNSVVDRELMPTEMEKEDGAM